MLTNQIEIVSSLSPSEVLANLRARGKEWRESSVPEDLRKLRVGPLAVRISDSKFDLRWTGSVSPLYNPVCFGTLERMPDGTRITASFGRDVKQLIPMFMMMALAGIQVAIEPRPIPSIILGLFLIILISMVMSNRDVGPLRDRLFDTLASAAQPPVAKDPGFRPISANGP